jgi:hypothetical protein
MVGRYFSIRSFNEFTEGASTISGGRLFHKGAILLDKNIRYLGRYVVKTNFKYD